MSDEQRSDENKGDVGGEPTAIPSISGETTGELIEERLASLRESAKPEETPKASELLDLAAAQAHEEALASEGSTKSIARDSLVELLKVEVKETEGSKPRQFGILKHTATRDGERLERLEDEEEDATRLNIDTEALAKLRSPMEEEDDEDPTTAVPQDTLDLLKASVESPHTEITREREAPDPEDLGVGSEPEEGASQDDVSDEEPEEVPSEEAPSEDAPPEESAPEPTAVAAPSLASDEEVLAQMNQRPWGMLVIVGLVLAGLIGLVLVGLFGNP